MNPKNPCLETSWSDVAIRSLCLDLFTHYYTVTDREIRDIQDSFNAYLPFQGNHFIPRLDSAIREAIDAI